MTYTYAILDVAPEVYLQVRALLEHAGYQHAFHADRDGEVIDMHGIALRADPATRPGPVQSLAVRARHGRRLRNRRGQLEPR